MVNGITWKILGFLGVLCLFSACSTSKHRNHFVLTHKARIKKQGYSDWKDIAPNTPFYIDGPTLVSAQGKIPLMIYPKSDKRTEKTQIQLLDVNRTWISEGLKSQLDLDISAILSRVQDVQIAIAEGDYKYALKVTHELQAKYPHVSYLGFLEASCQYLAGDIRKAKELLRKNLIHFPDNQVALQLYKKLAGSEAAHDFFRDVLKRNGGNTP